MLFLVLLARARELVTLYHDLRQVTDLFSAFLEQRRLVRENGLDLNLFSGPVLCMA